MGDTVLRSIHQIGQTAPGIYVYVEAVLLLATALVSYASELHPPRGRHPRLGNAPESWRNRPSDEPEHRTLANGDHSNVF